MAGIVLNIIGINVDRPDDRYDDRPDDDRYDDDRYDDDRDIYKGTPLFSVRECSLGIERKNVFVCLNQADMIK